MRTHRPRAEGIVMHSSWEPSSNQSPWQVFHIFYNIMTRKSFTVYNHQICVPKSWPFLWHNELVCPWCSFNLNWLSWLASLVHLWSLDRTELINKSPGCINPCFPFYLASLRQDLVITLVTTCTTLSSCHVGVLYLILIWSGNISVFPI